MIQGKESQKSHKSLEVKKLEIEFLAESELSEKRLGQRLRLDQWRLFGLKSGEYSENLKNFKIVKFGYFFKSYFVMEGSVIRHC